MKAKHDPVTEFFDEYPGAVPDVARRLRKVIRSALPDAREDLDRPGRVVGYSYGPGYAGLICTIILSKASVKLGVVGSAQMADPKNLLEGAGKRHRYVAFAQASDFERPGIRDLLHAAAKRWKDQQRKMA
ncbi:MAG TPA: DUF1801 domain-containing protein [Chthoniobacterales bacterium]|jgi:hypothetical protein